MSQTPEQSEPTFYRGEVAKILGCTPLTISNREKPDDKGESKYPEPKRDANNYRVYTLDDILNLQIITFGKTDTRPIMAALYDKGWTDHRRIGRLMDSHMNALRGK